MTPLMKLISTSTLKISTMQLISVDASLSLSLMSLIALKGVLLLRSISVSPISLQTVSNTMKVDIYILLPFSIAIFLTKCLCTMLNEGLLLQQNPSNFQVDSKAKSHPYNF